MSERIRRALGIKLGVLRQYPPRPLSVLRVIAEDRRDVPSMCIVVPSLNQGRFIGETLGSILDQDYPGLHLIVQDSLSDDETPAILAAAQTRGAEVNREKDDGQADALNRGFARTSAEIMAYLNSDDLYLPGALQAVGAFFADHPEVDFCYGNRLLIDETGKEIGRWILPGHDETVLRWIDYVPQETLFWRRRIWDRVGGAIGDLQFAMDWDLLLRFIEAGGAGRHLPHLFGLFRIHSQQKTQSAFRTRGLREIRALRARYSDGRFFARRLKHFMYLARSKKLDAAFAKRGSR